MMKYQSLYDFRISYQMHKAYRRCTKLYKAMDISDRCIDSTYRTYWKLLLAFRKQCKWTKKMLHYITTYTKLEHQIGFWRLLAFQKNKKQAIGVNLDRNCMTKCTRMGDILDKAVIMTIGRAFWRLERAGNDEIARTVNSSFIMQRKYQNQNELGVTSDTNIDAHKHSSIQEIIDSKIINHHKTHTNINCTKQIETKSIVKASYTSYKRRTEILRTSPIKGNLD